MSSMSSRAALPGVPTWAPIPGVPTWPATYEAHEEAGWRDGFETFCVDLGDVRITGNRRALWLDMMFPGVFLIGINEAATDFMLSSGTYMEATKILDVTSVVRINRRESPYA